MMNKQPSQPSHFLIKLMHSFIVLVFSLAAAFLIGGLGHTYYLHATSAHWLQVPAQLVDWDLQRRSTSRVQQTKLVVTYAYQFQGQTYQGQRLDFSLGADNFSGARRSRQLKALKSDDLKVYLNPAKPSESVLDRSLPAQQVAFATFFLFFPCGLGTVAILGFGLHAFSKVTGIVTDRWYMPVLGTLHGLPVLYPFLFARSELSPGSSLVLAGFGILLLISLTEIIRRLLNPERGKSLMKALPQAKPVYRSKQI